MYNETSKAMHEQEKSKAMHEQEKSNVSLMQTLLSDFNNQNSRQCEAIYNIRNKLNSVINKAVPETGVKEDNIPSMDFKDEIGRCMNLMRSNTNILESLVQHISEII